MDAVRRLALEGPECCRFSRMITDGESVTREEEGSGSVSSDTGTHAELELEDLPSSLNESQCEAVRRTRYAQVSLIWGPPGKNSTAIFSQFNR